MAQSITNGTQWGQLDRAVADALHQVAEDLRALVTSLSVPAADQPAWVRAIQQRCHELSDRLAALELRERWQTLSQPLSRLRTALQTQAATLSGTCSRGRVRQMRSALALSYEELRVQLQSARVRYDRSRALRSLKLPKLARSVFHLLMGVGSVLLYQLLLSRKTALAILSALLATFAALEVAKRCRTSINRFLVDRVFGAISRPDERFRINSATYYLSAMLLVTWVAPRIAACAAVLVLAVGDPLASLVGSRWGRRRLLGGKSLVGALAFVLGSCSAVCAYLFLSAPELAPFTLVAAAMSIAIVGGLTELLSGRLDDNFTIPVACAFTAMIWL